MKYNGNKAENVKIAYIGGGSRDWARSLMSDLAVNPDMSGDVYLYDLDYTAAKDNETIGNKFNSIEYTNSRWSYHAAATEEEAYTGADFVVISILPGSFDDMASDVHTPEKYGIYQSVGDTTGPGGILRAMRTAPMFEHIARCVEKYCPDAWVINYTNPMTLCVKALFPFMVKNTSLCTDVRGVGYFEGMLSELAKAMGCADALSAAESPDTEYFLDAICPFVPSIPEKVLPFG